MLLLFSVTCARCAVSVSSTCPGATHMFDISFTVVSGGISSTSVIGRIFSVTESSVWTGRAKTTLSRLTLSTVSSTLSIVTTRLLVSMTLRVPSSNVANL